MSAFAHVTVYNGRRSNTVCDLYGVDFQPMPAHEGVEWARMRIKTVRMRHLGHLRLLNGDNILALLGGMWVSEDKVLKIEGEPLLLGRDLHEVPRWQQPYVLRDLVLALVFKAPPDATRASVASALFARIKEIP